MKGDAFFRQLGSLCSRGIFLAVFSAVAILLAAPFAGAQSTGGRIRGTVVDPSGGAVAGAAVTLINEATHATREVQSGGSGEYIFIEVPVGTYEIDAAIQGFKKYVRKGVALELNQVITLDIALQIGAATESIEVTGTPPVVDTTSTQLGAVMNEIAVKQLPLNSRDTYQLLQLQPGVQSQIGSNLFYGSDQPGVVSVNGGRGRSNNYMVNGGDANDVFANLPAIQPSPDAIEEFKVISNTFDAEYGRNSGAVVNVVTKSGTNDWHGSAYEFFRNKVLNARGFFDSVKPDSKQNQFGGTWGGPIKKDSTFLFLSYEGRRVRQGQSSDVVNVPNAAEQAGDFSLGGNAASFGGTLTDNTVATILQNRKDAQGNTCAAGVAAEGGAAIATGTAYSAIFPGNQIPTACFDPVAVDLFNQFVKPFIQPGANTVQTVPTGRNRTDQFTVRFDRKLTATQQFSAYYYFNDLSKFDPFSFFQAAGSNLPGFGASGKTRVQQWNLSHSWTIGTTAVNEFRFSYFREGQKQLDHPQSTAPVTSVCKSPAAVKACFTGVPDSTLVDANNNTIATPNTPPIPSLGITTNLPGHTGVPFISIAGGFVIGNNFEGELPQVGNSFQWSDSFSKVWGKHSTKFGADVRRTRFDQQLFFELNGFFSYSGGGLNDLVGPDLFGNYFLGLPDFYNQGASQVENVRSTALYLFAQDSWKVKPSLTLNYGLRWEFTTPIADIGRRVQTFRPGQADTIYPCVLKPDNPSSVNLISTFGSTDCSLTGPGRSVFPLGLVIPGDKGIPNGLTQTYYKSFAPRIGLAWSPNFKNEFLHSLFGSGGKTSVRMGFGIFYNPVEQLVLEQFSAEPPFGGSNALSEVLFNTPYVFQSGGLPPNPFGGVINRKPGDNVDWSVFRPILLFGQFQPKLRPQYSEQYNLTIQREIAKNLLFQIGYVGSQGHRLLATHDLNFGNPQTCNDLNNLSLTGNAAYASLSCGPFFEDSPYGFVLQQGDNLTLPGGNVVTGATGGTPIALVGLRKYSSPLCDPKNGFDPVTVTFINGCPPDGVPVFGSIFAQDTIGNSNYHSLQLLLEKHFSNGLQFQGAYTFSKSIDNASSFEELLNPFNPRLSRSVSLFDARHRFVFSYYWELPIPKHEGFAGKVANGWALSGIVTYQSGFPVRLGISSSSSLSTNDQELLDGSGFDFETAGEPDFVFPFHKLDPRNGTTCAFGTGPNAGPNTPSTGPVPCSPIHAGFDPNGFTLQAPGKVGNAPRAICCAGGIQNYELGVLKSTSITERTRLEFRAEFFNAFNHTQFGSPDGNFADGTDFGRVKNTRPPRQIQFALKLVF